MFDNPKKELERLEQQLLAAEASDPEDSDFDELDEAEYEDPIMDDEELMALLGRSAGYEADIPEDHAMNEDRYVAPKKKKGIRGLLVIAFLEAIAIIALAAWWLERLL